MSTFKVEVVKFSLSPHPNADTLSIAHVKGWECVVKTEDFINETHGIYLPLDSVADKNHPLLGFLKGKKVKASKIRKVISQGLLIPRKLVTEHLSAPVFEGQDLQKELGITKWQPEIKVFVGQPSASQLQYIDPPAAMNKYTDIEHLKSYPGVLKFGEEVVITEKLHGTSFRAGYIDHKFYVGSRNRIFRTKMGIIFENKFLNKISDSFPVLGQFLHSIGFGKSFKPEKQVYTTISKEAELQYKLMKISMEKNHADVVLFGEIVGPGIQDLSYGVKEPKLYAYDIQINGVYLPPKDFITLTAKYDIDAVPVLKQGKFSQKDLELRLGKTTINDARHCREGVVIEPAKPRYDQLIGRVKLKVIGEDYLLRSNAKDN